MSCGIKKQQKYGCVALTLTIIVFNSQYSQKYNQ